MDKLVKQVLSFGVVGVVCFGIDYCLMILLAELGKVHYLLASGISFSTSVVINYWLSMHFVFASRKDKSKVREFAVFVLLSITGLLLTEALMWGGVDKLGFHYMTVKIAVTGIVMIYNFVTRKIFLEERVGNEP